MEYIIKSFKETTGQITVQFKDFQPITIDLPIDENNCVLSGESLNTYIIGFAPISLYERQQKIASGGIANASEIIALVQEPAPAPIVTPTVEQQWGAIRAQRDQLLYNSDWTQLPDAPLSEDKKQAWATYRTILRNTPQTNTNVDNVIFPTEPV